MTWNLDDFDYELPEERIAQQAVEPRDRARLLVAERRGGIVEHAHVSDLPRLLRPGDLLIGNATRVRPARLRGMKGTGGKAEALLLGPAGADRYEALVRCRGRLREGQGFVFERGARRVEARLEALAEDGRVVLSFAPGADPYALGEMPLPPYIARPTADRQDEERYQTVFARAPGSVAAPTAGLHLTAALLDDLRAAGVGWAEVVLHVGAGTFRPVTEDALHRGELHAEPFELPASTAEAIAETRARGGRVVALGTTTARVLESCARDDGGVEPGAGETRLFLRPGSRLRVVDGLLTNFHLPRSSLLLLVAAFAGRDRVLSWYREAVARSYRFYSYGDAMLIL